MRPEDERYSSGRVKEARQMKEDRGCKTDGIQTIEHAAMTFDQMRPIFYSAIAFDCRHDETAEKAGHCDQKREQCGLPWAEGSDPPQGCTECGYR